MGIEVPKEGYEDKTIYIWTENVLGYLSASKVASEKNGTSFEQLWSTDSKHYYVHGKDNIPFHTIILPSLLIANGNVWHLPDQIVLSEYKVEKSLQVRTMRSGLKIYLIITKQILFVIFLLQMVQRKRTQIFHGESILTAIMENYLVHMVIL